MTAKTAPSDEEIHEIDTKKRAIPEPTPEDFAAIRAWGMEEDPFIAAKDYSALKVELRWLNKYQRKAHFERWTFRDAFARRGIQEYWKTMRRPITRNKWEYLKLRKSWYIVPLEWDRFAEPDCRGVLDVGCGDGDGLQRVADHIAQSWAQKGHPGHPMELVGFDLNPGRIENARSLCRSPHDKISIRFQVGDAATRKLPFEDKAFSYCTAMSIFEMLEDEQAKAVMGELCRVVGKGIYLEDLVDEGPGGSPRADYSYLLEPNGFRVDKQMWMFTEPFTLEGTKDPLHSSPIMRELVLFAAPMRND